MEGDETKCGCNYCHCTLPDKLCDTERHREIAKHKKAEEPFCTQRQTTIPFEKVSHDVWETEGNVSLFIAKQCSLCVVDHLSELWRVQFADGNGCQNLRLKRSKRSAVVCNVIGSHSYSDLRSDVSDQKYSLLIDESDDIMVTKLLGITIQFYSEGKKIVVTLLDLTELTDCDADGLYDAIRKSLKNNGLQLQNFTTIGTECFCDDRH